MLWAASGAAGGSPAPGGAQPGRGHDGRRTRAHPAPTGSSLGHGQAHELPRLPGPRGLPPWRLYGPEACWPFPTSPPPARPAPCFLPCPGPGHGGHALPFRLGQPSGQKGTATRYFSPMILSATRRPSVYWEESVLGSRPEEGVAMGGDGEGDPCSSELRRTSHLSGYTCVEPHTWQTRQRVWGPGRVGEAPGVRGFKLENLGPVRPHLTHGRRRPEAGAGGTGSQRGDQFPRAPASAQGQEEPLLLTRAPCGELMSPRCRPDQGLGGRRGRKH